MNATARRIYWRGYHAMLRLAHEYANADIAFTELYQSNAGNTFIKGARRAYEQIKRPRPRHCYAERTPYGIGTMSDADTLARFNSRRKRAEFLEAMEEAEPRQWQAVTLAEVRHRYDVTAFDDPDRREPAEQGMPATIHQRPRYQF